MALSRQATDWMIRISRNPDEPGLRPAFEDWLLRSPAHRRAWEETCMVWKTLGQAEVHASARTIGFDGGVAARKRRHIPRKIAGAAAAAALAFCLLVIFLPSAFLSIHADFSTRTGEVRQITLEDGSSVVLAAGSALRSDFGEDGRNVTLLRGEAYFDVRHESDRPFTVTAGAVTVKVLGTAFDVDMTRHSTDIALARGSVNASVVLGKRSISETLIPGELLSIDNASGTVRKSAIPIEDVGSLREGRLYVSGETITAVAEKIQRYHPAWISIADGELGRKRVSGIYDVTSPDEALGALVEPYGGKVRAIGGLARIISRF